MRDKVEKQEQKKVKNNYLRRVGFEPHALSDQSLNLAP
jgi:hypothetical protein